MEERGRGQQRAKEARLTPREFLEGGHKDDAGEQKPEDIKELGFLLVVRLQKFRRVSK